MAVPLNNPRNPNNPLKDPPLLPLHMPQAQAPHPFREPGPGSFRPLLIRLLQDCGGGEAGEGGACAGCGGGAGGAGGEGKGEGAGEGAGEGFGGGGEAGGGVPGEEGEDLGQQGSCAQGAEFEGCL